MLNRRITDASGVGLCEGQRCPPQPGSRRQAEQARPPLRQQPITQAPERRLPAFSIASVRIIYATGRSDSRSPPRKKFAPRLTWDSGRSIVQIRPRYLLTKPPCRRIFVAEIQLWRAGSRRTPVQWRRCGNHRVCSYGEAISLPTEPVHVSRASSANSVVLNEH